MDPAGRPPEPFSNNSQGTSSPGTPDAQPETAVPGEVPSSTQEGDATVLRGEQSLQSTLHAPTTSTPEARTPAAAGGTRFRILRPHARGGLGEVFVARDEELNRDVALKEIRGEHAHNNDSRGRFLLEAEITGGLEHPGIVPVYGLGQYPDGRPYYAMRFIQGDSLKEAISAYHSEKNTPASDSERYLQLRKLLGRFVDVCQAVSYAHSRGVLHRDLKPGNIMLGKYGETLVVDWGLAKVQGKDDATTAQPDQLLQPTSGDGVTPTVMGSALGTPAYMPPEQAAGRLNELGPASDVYSLGATLYHLLTGRASFKANTTEEVLQAVQQGNFPRPSEINSNVPKSLEAVCLKAMAIKPRDRYTSPQVLADDIERWLADEPVQAFPEPFVQRAKRWVRKHPTLTTTSAAVVLLSAVGLGTFSSILSGKNDELTRLNDDLRDSYVALEEKNTALDEANADLTAANAREVEARNLAQRNELAAREQSQLALSTLTSVIFDVQHGLEDLPGGSEVRRRLLTTSIEKLDDVASEFVGQTAVDLNLVMAFVSMGDLLLQSSTNSGEFMLPDEPVDDGSRSSVELAHTLYSRSLEMVEQIVGPDPEPKDLGVVSGTYSKLGDVNVLLGRLDDAQACYLQALQLTEQASEQLPGDTSLQNDFVVHLVRLGDLSLRLGRTDEALAYFQQQNEICVQLAEAAPDDANAQRDLSISLDRLGRIHLLSGHPELALTYLQGSLAIVAQLAAADPADVVAQRDHWVALGMLGDVSLRSGQSEGAATYYRQALEIAERLATQDPLNSEAQRDWSLSLCRLADSSQRMGQLQDAMESLTQALQIAQRLVDEDAQNSETQRFVSMVHESLGEVHLQSGSIGEALAHFQNCHEVRTRLAAANPTNAQLQEEFATSAQNLGDLSLANGEPIEAEAYFETAINISEILTQADPMNGTAIRKLAILYGSRGNAFLESGRVSGALSDFHRCHAMFESLVAQDPSHARLLDLSIAYDRIGDVTLQIGDPTEAREYYERSLQIRESLSVSDPNDSESRHGLSLSHYNVGRSALVLLDFDAAIAHLTTAISILDLLIEGGQNSTQLRAERDMFVDTLRNAERESELAGEMLEDWETFISRPGARSRLSTRISFLARSARFAEIPQAAAVLRSLDAENAEDLYNAACGYAMCANAIQPVQGESLTAEQHTQHQEYIDLALACLRESIAAGWSDFEHMRQDPDLAVLRELPEFEELMHASLIPMEPEAEQL